MRRLVWMVPVLLAFAISDSVTSASGYEDKAEGATTVAESECIYCEDWYEEYYNNDTSYYRIEYGDYCGFNYNAWNCVECMSPGGLDCSYSIQYILWYPDIADLCTEIPHCQSSGEEEFAEVENLVRNGDLAGLRQMILTSDGKIYYSETRRAVQILGCRNEISASLPIGEDFDASLLARLP